MLYRDKYINKQSKIQGFFFKKICLLLFLKKYFD